MSQMRRTWLVVGGILLIGVSLLALVLANTSNRATSSVLSNPSEPSTIQLGATSPTPPPSLTAIPARPSPTPRSPTALPPRINAVGQLVIGAIPEDIPAIMDAEPLLVDVEAGNAEYDPDTMVIGINLAGGQTAYPLSFLSFHEVVNDRVGNIPVVVTWCPLCFSAVVYERRVDQRVLDFRVSGYLFQSNLVLEDLQTHTLWSQLTGISLRGVGRKQLRPVSFQLTTWAAWQAAFPGTRIISGRLSPYADRFDYTADPYRGYYGGGAAGIGNTSSDERLPQKAIVTGLEFDRVAVAIPFNTLYEVGVVQMIVGQQAVVVFMETGSATPIAYSPVLPDGQMLTFEWNGAVFSDIETGSIWNPQTGIALEGELVDTRLRPLPYRTGFWFAWADHFPHTTIWGVDFEG